MCSGCGQVFVFGGGKKGKCNKCLSTVKKKPKKKPIPGEPPLKTEPGELSGLAGDPLPASMPAVPPVERLEDRLKKLCVDMERALTFRGDKIFVSPGRVASWNWGVTTDPEWVSIKMELVLSALGADYSLRANITGQWNIKKRDFRVDNVETTKETP